MAGNGARLAVGSVLAFARSEERGTHGGGDPAGHVHDGASGEVVERGLELVQPAATPLPTHDDRIDDRRDDGAVDHVRLELRAFGHGSRHDRRGGRGERDLKCEEHELVESPVGEDTVASEEPAVTTDVLSGTGEVATECDGVSDGEEQQGSHAEVHQVLHEDVGHVLGAGEAGFDQRETGLHEDHQDRGHQDPHVVERGLERVDRSDRVGVFRESDSG